MSAPELSVVIHTKNSARTLQATLESAQFAKEIVVIDMHSDDETVAIARKFTKKIYQHKDVGYVEPARNFGLSKATGEWVLVLDADEQVSPSLQEHLVNVIARPEADAYFLPRKNLIFSRWMQMAGWWPDFQLRLFRRGRVTWSSEMHSVPQVEGKIEYFPAEERYALQHENYTDVSQFIGKLNIYTSLQAKERLERGEKKVFSSQDLMDIFANEFAKRSLALDGVEDGLHGVSVSLLQAMYEAVAYLKQWQLEGFQQTSPVDVDAMFVRWQKIWRYWRADYHIRHSRGFKQLVWRLRRKFSL